MTGTDAPRSVIHDIGFRHYDGPRLGRGWAFRSLLVETLRGAFGLGRPARYKIMPWVLVGLFTVPALVIVTVAILTKLDTLPLSYTQYPVAISLLTSLFVAGRAPYAVSRDIRDGVIPLYLSRPITRRDYVLAKVLGLAAAVFAFIATPVTVLFVGALLAKYPVGHEVWAWLGGLLMAAALSVLVTTIALAIASFTKRRGFGVAAILATFVLTSGVSNVLIDVVSIKSTRTHGTFFAVLDPYLLVDGLAAAWLGVEPQHSTSQPDGAVGALVFTAVLVVAIAGAVAILMRRFRKVGGA
ncbi:ABC transporter permease [Demequina capsici]|uniref:ABC transporter permease n=1 Tax=Demequina capsici TaxID=3075620 RepID=A0AA96J8B5_9MICO|nr:MULTISPECIES: ABC transporter permease [unclassified Demequina]WNM25275.1 ABC transporter permease [Demequina sp. OYTSA14]WNM28172.1 ABC transporter permease [Demequina sp. PMTSA13]